MSSAAKLLLVAKALGDPKGHPNRSANPIACCQAEEDPGYFLGGVSHQFVRLHACRLELATAPADDKRANVCARICILLRVVVG